MKYSRLDSFVQRTFIPDLFPLASINITTISFDLGNTSDGWTENDRRAEKTLVRRSAQLISDILGIPESLFFDNGFYRAKVGLWSHEKRQNTDWHNYEEQTDGDLISDLLRIQLSRNHTWNSQIASRMEYNLPRKLGEKHLGLRTRNALLISELSLGFGCDDLETIDAFMNQEVPYALSPEVQSDTIKDLLERAKSIMVAPLLAGALQASSLINSGEYVAALACTLVASTITIIFISTISIADYIRNYLAKKSKRS